MSILSTSSLSSNIYMPPYETYEDRKIKELQRRTKELEDQLYAITAFKNKKTEVELPERYIINDGATILFWKGGSKTIVKRAEDDEFNPRLAFLTAFFQHYCGMSKNKANKYLASLQVEQKPEPKVEKVEEKTKKNTPKFKVGDKVIGNKMADSQYSITKEGWIGTVTSVNGECICVKGTGILGELGVNVESKYFDKYKEDK